MDIHLLDDLAVKLKNQPKDAVSGWVLWSKVDTNGFDVF